MKRAILTFLLLFLVGCSQKTYYQPKKISKNMSYKLDLKTTIDEVSRDGLTYENGLVVTVQRGMLKYKIPKGYHFVYDAKNAILIADTKGNIQIIQNGKPIFKHTFETAIASGTVSGRYGAFVLANNRVILYDFHLDKSLFDQALEPSFALDNRVANPIFVKNVVIFPTLDGRLLIVDRRSKKIVNDIALSNKDLFNNIIFLKEINGTIVAATRYKVVLLTQSAKSEKRFDIKDILFDGSYVYIFTNAGDVVKLDQRLNVVAKKSFKNATFVAVSNTPNKIYAVEKEGYLMIMDKNLKNATVIKLPEPITKAIFAYKNKFFIDRYFLKAK